MSSSELLALALAALVVVVVAGAVQLVGVIGRRRLISRRPDYGNLASRLGFELKHQRWVFSTHVTRLVGTRGDLEFVLELDHSEELAYMRLWVEFPMPLDIGFRVVTESDESMWSRVVRMREVEIGAPTFDPHFVLLARDEERITRLLDHDIRRMMLELYHDTEFLTVDDDAMTLLVSKELSEDEVARFVDLSAQLALRLSRGADGIHESERAETAAASITSAFTPMPGDIKAIGEGKG